MSECWTLGCEAAAVEADIFCGAHDGKALSRDAIRRRALMGALLEERGTPYEVEVYAGRSDDGYAD